MAIEKIIISLKDVKKVSLYISEAGPELSVTYFSDYNPECFENKLKSYNAIYEEAYNTILEGMNNGAAFVEIDFSK